MGRARRSCWLRTTRILQERRKGLSTSRMAWCRRRHMRVSESFRSSFRALSHSKMRTFLTMLGVIIGVFSVVMLTSIGEGVKQQVAFEVESLGANLLYVFPGRMEMPTMSQAGSKLGVRTGFGSLVSAKSSLIYED